MDHYNYCFLCLHRETTSDIQSVQACCLRFLGIMGNIVGMLLDEAATSDIYLFSYQQMDKITYRTHTDTHTRSLRAVTHIYYIVYMDVFM